VNSIYCLLKTAIDQLTMMSSILSVSKQSVD